MARSFIDAALRGFAPKVNRPSINPFIEGVTAPAAAEPVSQRTTGRVVNDPEAAPQVQPDRGAFAFFDRQVPDRAPTIASEAPTDSTTRASSTPESMGSVKPMPFEEEDDSLSPSQMALRDMASNASRDTAAPAPAPAPEERTGGTVYNEDGSVDYYSTAIRVATDKNDGFPPTSKEIDETLKELVSNTGKQKKQKAAVTTTPSAEQSGGKKKSAKRAKASQAKAAAAPKPGLIDSMLASTDYPNAIEQAFAIVKKMRSNEENLLKVLMRVNSKDVWDSATEPGQLGLRIVYGFHRAENKQVDKALEILRDAVIDYRQIAGDDAARQLAARLMAEMKSDKARQAFVDALAAVVEPKPQTETIDDASPDIPGLITEGEVVEAEDVIDEGGEKVLSRPEVGDTVGTPNIPGLVTEGSAVEAEIDGEAQPTSIPAMTDDGRPIIAGFQGEYRFLSNFWPVEIVYDGAVYPSAEHAFQAAKTTSRKSRRPFQVGGAHHDPSNEKKSGKAARAAGKKLNLRTGWDNQVKFRTLAEILRIKYAPGTPLAEQLIATGNAVLVEENQHGDTVYGTVNGRGKNMLGKILMKIRSELNEQEFGADSEALDEVGADGRTAGEIYASELASGKSPTDAAHIAREPKQPHKFAPGEREAATNELLEEAQAEAKKEAAAVEAAKEEIYSKAYTRYRKASTEIERFYNEAKIALSGDTSKMFPVLENGKVVKSKNNKPKMTPRTVHSQLVSDEVRKTLEVFGHSYTRANEKYLFKAFIVLRSYGPDRDQKFFNKDGDKVTIKDEVFIKFLEDLRLNFADFKHPLAYAPRMHRYKFPGTAEERFPLPITPDLVEWFSANMVDPEKAKKDFTDYSFEQWHNRVKPRIMSKAVGEAQRLVLLDMEATIARMWGDKAAELGIQDRPANSLVDVDEVFNQESLFALGLNSSDTISAEVERIRIETSLAEVKMAHYQRLRGRPRKSVARSTPVNIFADPRREAVPAAKIVDDAVETAEEIASFGHRAAMSLTTYARTAGVVGMLPLMVTAIPEHGIGVTYQSAGQNALDSTLAWTTGVRPESADDLVEATLSHKGVDALEYLFSLQSQTSNYGIINAAARNVKFTEGAARTRTETVHDQWLALMFGNKLFAEKTLRLFMRHLIYQFTLSQQLYLRAEAKGKWDPNQAPPLMLTAGELLAIHNQNPDGFWKLVAETEEGRAAIHYAANAALSGSDTLSMALRRMTVNPYWDLAFAFVGGYYLKFGIRSLMRMIPFSTSAVYILKKGPVNYTRVALEKAGKLPEGSTKLSNEYMLGGKEGVRLFDEGAMMGLGQSLMVDVARLGTQFAVLSLVILVIGLSGGVEPPDEEDLYHLWYEYKIMGEPIKTAWYWMELLGPVMPLAVAYFAPDESQRGKIIEYGLLAELENGAWVNVAETMDLILNFDQHLQEAQAMSEGYAGSEQVSTAQYGKTLLATFAARRAAQTFEPAVVRTIYNEAGHDWGAEKLAHSNTMVYTKDPDDGEDDRMPPLTRTSWHDAQIRKVSDNSFFLGTFFNIVNGYYVDNENVQKTGYLKYQKPVVTNMDPYQADIMRDFLIYDEDGEEVPYDKWSPDQKAAIGNLVLKEVAEFGPTQLAADGVVIPFDARIAAKDVLEERWADIETEYRDREAAGEFWYPYSGLSKLDTIALQQEAWNEKDAEQKSLQALRTEVFSDEIPYMPTVLNRWVTSYRPLYVWNEKSDRAGEPASKFDFLLNRDEVDFSMYPSGDRKSALWPFGIVDDAGKNTYDSQTAAPWQNKYTNMDNVRRRAEGNLIDDGMYKGRDLWGLVSGEGAIGPGATKIGDWDPDTLVIGARAHIVNQMLNKKPTDEQSWLGADYDYDEEKKKKGSDDAKPSWTWGSGGGGGGGGSYAPNIYSRPARSLNVDKPAGLYSKTPSFTRFDFLRPSVATKGSREAYRREDF